MTQLTLIQQYIDCFDNCRPITYRGFTLKPFLTKDIRRCNLACYCLAVDPTEYNDITLMPLRRLGLIITIIQRMVSNEVPSSLDVVEKYALTIQSFGELMGFLFEGHTFDFTDPENPNRKRILRIINKNGEYEIITEKEFEEFSELILYYNGVDTSYKKIPAAIRKEAERVRELRNKQNKNKAPSIEKMIDAAFLILKDYDKVLNMPVRKFYNLITNIQNREEYSILMSGMYITKGVEHWMSGDYTKNPYEGIFETEAEAKKKLENF